MTRRAFFLRALGLAAAAHSLAVQQAQLDALARGVGVSVSNLTPRWHLESDPFGEIHAYEVLQRPGFVITSEGSADERTIEAALAAFRAELRRRDAELDRPLS